MFVYRFSLRFVFIFICRRWKIVRISCDINRTREEEGERGREFFHCQLPCVAFHCFCHNGYAYLWGTRERDGEREGGESVARVDRSVLISCLLGKPQKYLITCQKVCSDMCGMSTEINWQFPLRCAPFHCQHLNTPLCPACHHPFPSASAP